MFSLAGLCVMLFFLYLRPQEAFEALRRLPMLNLSAALAVLGLVIDIRLHRAKVSPVPALRYLILFFFWGMLATLVKAGPAAAIEGFNRIIIPCIVFLILAHGATSFRALQTVLLLVLALGLSIASIGVLQAFSPKGCFAVKDTSDRDYSTAAYDGRPCESPQDCHLGDAEPGMEYLCERPGALGTASVSGGRVRFRGILQDPNELALAIGIVVPFAFGFLERRRTAGRMLLLIAAIGTVGLCTIHTNSRGGQLVFLAVLGTYFVRRFGLVAGAICGAVVAIPILLLGGRSGDEAEASAIERTETLYVGLTMIFQNPIFGVGVTRFTEHHYLTAHNSYILTWAEQGLPGYFLWSAMLYLSVKTLVMAERRYQGRSEAGAAVSWAKALLSSWAGLGIGIFFLSFSYHVVLFVYMGLCGAFYQAVKRHDPSFEVKLSLKEAAALLLGDVLIIAVIFIYLRFKL